MPRPNPKSAGRKAAKPKGPARPRILRPLAKWTVTLAIWGGVGLLSVVAYYAYDLPGIDKALLAQRRPAVILLAADGSRLATQGDFQGAPLQARELPAHLIDAVLATEDRRFRAHWGVDAIGLARAMFANARAGRIVQGGSTLTQQLAKNLFLTPKRTLKRKVQELLLALWLESKFSKDQILTIYLNRVYLGAGTYGVDAAARRYFGRSARRLTLFQSALLAGLLKAPSRLNPIRDKKAARARARVVLANMVAAGYLSQAQAQKAGRGRAARLHVRTASTTPGRHFVDWVLDQLPGYVGPGAGDITVVTTFDPRLQKIAQARIARLMAGAAASRGVGQVAFVALSPRGAVRAMVGGRDYAKSQFNRAVQSLRQPGSAFKLFVYLAALEAGMTPQTRLVDGPVAVGNWRPRNYGGRYRGEVTLGEALAHSINTVAVKLAERVGRDKVLGAARRLGLTSRLRPIPSLALGAGEVSLLELAAAYAVFANGGDGVWAHGIIEIRDKAGRVLYRRAGDGPGRVVAARNTAAMNRMLAGVIEKGTGARAAFTHPAAGKTGTSQGFRDAWFLGYSAQLVAGVWLGNDDARPMKRVTGGGLPARLWRDIMAESHKGRPARPLPGLVAPERGFWEFLVGRLKGVGG